ncbi:MAG: DUF3299 domain-containing protein [Gammaproteobacteria bacterium]|nr:DUF3299 domain-containing protein [Gammaproteobacteria bacterium]
MYPTTPIRSTLIIGVLALAGCSEAPPEAPHATAEPAPPAASTPADAPQAQTATAAPPGADEPPRVERITPLAQGPDGIQEIEWDALIPDDYRPDQLMAEYEVDDLADDDPRAQELMDKLRELWDQAPVREDLDGAAVKLPGFVVPVEDDTDDTNAFLLVPYYGACVHVPPPPANQTVFVLAESGAGSRPGLFDIVWVSGTMSVKRTENDIAEAGYTLYASEIAPYE